MLEIASGQYALGIICVITHGGRCLAETFPLAAPGLAEFELLERHSTTLESKAEIHTTSPQLVGWLQRTRPVPAECVLKHITEDSRQLAVLVDDATGMGDNYA